MLGSNFSNNDTILIQVDSLLNLEKGWEIRSLNKDKFLNQLNEHRHLFGIISRGSKGKNFILRSLVKDANIKQNEGLAFTRVGDSPENYFNILSSSGVRMPSSDENTSEMESELIEEDNEETNHFIQRFIIWYSPMSIVVIGQMNASKSNFYHRIKYDCILKNKQKVYVIHNLKDFGRIEQVEKYIQTIFIGMLKLEIDYFIYLPGNSKDLQNKHRNFYIDRISDCCIYHLVSAKEGTEAGEYFNGPSFYHIGNQMIFHSASVISSISNSLKDYLVTQSSELFVDSIEEDEIVISENKIKLVPKLQNGYLKNYQFKSLLNAHCNDKQLSLKGCYYYENDFLVFEFFSLEPINIIAYVTCESYFYIFTFKGVYLSSGKEFQRQFKIPLREFNLKQKKIQKTERKENNYLIYYEKVEVCEVEDEVDFYE